DTVIELLCAGHGPAAIIKLLKYPKRTGYDITKKWEESGISKRKEHKPRSDGSARPHLWLSIGDAHVHSRQEAWGPSVVVPWMDSVASGTPYTFQQDSAPAHKAKLVQSWLKRIPDLNPCYYYFNVTSLKASIKSEMNKLDPAE
ncbi:Transposable element tcb1 transposase, partial [Caligus rogercresseyi]